MILGGSPSDPEIVAGAQASPDYARGCLLASRAAMPSQQQRPFRRVHGEAWPADTEGQMAPTLLCVAGRTSYSCWGPIPDMRT